MAVHRYVICRMQVVWLVAMLVGESGIAQDANESAGRFRAGATAIDISPTKFPVRVAGGFLEGQSNELRDQLFARAIVMDDGSTKIVMVVVDTCMMTQELIDEAKTLASKSTGIPTNQMMVSATHTHAAPAAMSCLGTRQDKEYADSLPSKIAEAIVSANEKLEVARIGWAAIDDWEHTHNRRWIRKPENKVVDPFGNPTGLAHMHPGYLSADVIGPSGPVDPTLSVISLQTRDGRPMAVLANYSQHYFGASAVSSDYYGLFCKHVASLLEQTGDGNGPFVAAISQGTSGDLMWMDYGSAAKPINIDGYAEAVARYAEIALGKIEYRDWVPLSMVEKDIRLNYRVPDEQRLAWARPIAAKVENELPKNIPEVYAMEATILDERQQTNVKLQAIRIGDLSIATLPNEVYALTGLKLRGRSPSQSHFNIELANGAEGYIPPPEQHTLSGYTTWPARTAGLEVQAEPKIVDALVDALEQVTGHSPRVMQDKHGPYADAILEAKPTAYWRLNDEAGQSARNAVAGGHPAKLEPGYAFYLPGVGSGTGIGDKEHLLASAFSGDSQINRAIHFAGGELSAESTGLKDRYSFAFWFWLGERSGASSRSGVLCIGPNGEKVIAQQSPDHSVRLQVGEAQSAEKWPADEWNLAVVIRDRNELKVLVNGAAQPAIQTTIDSPAVEPPNRLRFGVGLQGKLDEIAVFNRPLSDAEVKKFWDASGIAEQRARDSTERQHAPLSKAASSPPLSAEASLAKIHVPRGYRVELVASEPEVIDPVAFDWDAAGRLWVVEMSDYPLGMDGQGKAGGRIRVLEDVDRDGRFEKSQLFADGLNFPNGILTWRDGVLVTAAPDILFLRDTDDDGTADQREVLFSGFNEGNQQLRMNHLRWGLDNWVYCANGGHHANHGTDTRVTSHRNGVAYQLGSRDFRFQPDSGALELESGPSQFGRNRDAFGHWFGTQNANPLWHYVLSDRYLGRNPYVPTGSPLKHLVGPGSPPVYPASSLEKRYHNFDQSGRFTSACSSLIYGDDLLFGSDALLHSFTCEPFHNLVQHNVLTDKGVSYQAHRPLGEGQYDFFASEDRWCRPVMVRTGPDGGLWIADMVRYMIEHPDWLPAEGKAELLPHYRLGDDLGRIYRIMPAANKVAPLKSFAAATTAELVATLESANDWHRDKAHQMLVWSGDLAAVPLLEKLAQTSNAPQTRVQSLWVLDGLNAVEDSILIGAFKDAHPRVRENAIRLAERHESAAIVEAAVKLTHDPDSKVGLQLALSLGEWKSPLAAQALVELAERYVDESFLIAAIMSSSLPHSRDFIQGVMTSHRSGASAFRVLLLRQSLSAQDKASLTLLIKNVLESDEQTRLQSVDAFLLSLQRTGTDIDQLGQSDAENVLSPWVVKIEELLASARGTAMSSDLSISQRVAAARLLCRSTKYRDAGVELLAQWLRPQVDAALQTQILETMSQSGAEQVPVGLANAWRVFSPDLRSRAVDAWLSRESWSIDLLDRIQAEEIAASSLDLAQRERLLQHPNKTISDRAKVIFQLNGDSSRKQIIDQYRQAFQLTGQVANGQTVFVRACASCHRRGELGHAVGPSLATVVEHTNEKLLTNILDPNVDIQPGFQAYTCLLDSGEVLSGILASETANSLTIKQANGALRTVSREEIELLQSSNRSFMPEGLETVVTKQEMADLLEFLHQPIDVQY